MLLPQLVFCQYLIDLPPVMTLLSPLLRDMSDLGLESSELIDAIA